MSEAQGGNRTKAFLIAAHPDDETLWAGGTLLMHPEWDWTVATLCRAGDPDRAAKFSAAMKRLGARGRMRDLDDGPEQRPLEQFLVQETVMSLMAGERVDLLLTHSPYGEYTSHRRHEETSKAVLALWQTEEIIAGQLWMFAYEDGGGLYPPKPVARAHKLITLPEYIWRAKLSIVTDIYGFPLDSFEAGAATRQEAFWVFDSPGDLRSWLRGRGAVR